MKVDYLSEFGFRLSDYGKYSTIVLFLGVALLFSYFGAERK